MPGPRTLFAKGDRFGGVCPIGFVFGWLADLASTEASGQGLQREKTPMRQRAEVANDLHRKNHGAKSHQRYSVGTIAIESARVATADRGRTQSITPPRRLPGPPPFSGPVFGRGPARIGTTECGIFHCTSLTKNTSAATRFISQVARSGSIKTHGTDVEGFARSHRHPKTGFRALMGWMLRPVRSKRL